VRGFTTVTSIPSRIGGAAPWRPGASGACPLDSCATVPAGCWSLIILIFISAMPVCAYGQQEMVGQDGSIDIKTLGCAELTVFQWIMSESAVDKEEDLAPTEAAHLMIAWQTHCLMIAKGTPVFVQTFHEGIGEGKQADSTKALCVRPDSETKCYWLRFSALLGLTSC
jgi:hypothetical protein